MKTKKKPSSNPKRKKKASCSNQRKLKKQKVYNEGKIPLFRKKERYF